MVSNFALKNANHIFLEFIILLVALTFLRANRTTERDRMNFISTSLLFHIIHAFIYILNDQISPIRSPKSTLCLTLAKRKFVFLVPKALCFQCTCDSRDIPLKFVWNTNLTQQYILNLIIYTQHNRFTFTTEIFQVQRSRVYSVSFNEHHHRKKVSTQKGCVAKWALSICKASSWIIWSIHQTIIIFHFSHVTTICLCAISKPSLSPVAHLSIWAKKAPKCVIWHNIFHWDKPFCWKPWSVTCSFW